jgi:hypothetical protein
LGLTLNLDLGTYPDCCMAYGLYELATARWVGRLLGPGDHFVDVGANIGYFTLIEAQRPQTDTGFELQHALLAHRIPEPQRAIQTAGGDAGTIGTELDSGIQIRGDACGVDAIGRGSAMERVETVVDGRQQPVRFPQRTALDQRRDGRRDHGVTIAREGPGP